MQYKSKSIIINILPRSLQLNPDKYILFFRMNTSHQWPADFKKNRSSSGWVSSTHRDTNPVFPWWGACIRGLGPFLPELQQSHGLSSNQKIKRSQWQSYNLKKRQKRQKQLFINNMLLFLMAKIYLKNKGKKYLPYSGICGHRWLFGTILAVPNACCKTGSILFPYKKSS